MVRSDGDDDDDNNAQILTKICPARFVVMNFVVHSIMYSYYALRAMRST